VAFAGWVGLLITGLQLLPAANLDGGHVARAMVSERFRMILTGGSIIFLIIQGAYPMALLLLFMSMTKHPGALDDVSKVSNSRKGLTIVLVAIFFLSMIAL
jgi:membrane-associated protease RseP (regulator of RpoE activity)